jgi:TatD DNase family protein
VRAYSDFLQILKQFKHTYIFHGFNANHTIAKNLITHNAYLSFGNELLKNTKLQQTFKQLPLNKIFFETDDSSINVKDIYIFAAKLLNVELLKLQEHIQSNFKEVFGIDVRKLA